MNSERGPREGRYIKEGRKWDQELTSFTKGSIDVAIAKEFYANLYDPEDKSPKQVRVRGHLIKFDEHTLNTFLKTLVILKRGKISVLIPGLHS